MAAPTLDTKNADESVEQEIVRLISSQSRTVPLPTFFVLATMALIAAVRVPNWTVSIWFAAVVSIIAYRYFSLGSLPDRSDLSAGQRLHFIVRANLIAGVAHASSLFAFLSLSDAERAFFSILLMGLCTGTVSTSAGYRPALLAYITPVLSALAVVWAFSSENGTGWVERVFGLLLLFYAIVLLGLAKEVNRGIVEAWSIRLRERELNKKLQSALTIAESASSAKTRFLAAASHDLRQPLHTITMLGAALSMRPADTRGKEIITLLNDVTESFSEQLDGLLDISKLDAGVIKADVKPVCITDLISQHMAEIEGLIREKQLTPALNCFSRGYAATDPLLFLRVVRNLTHNAIKFTNKGGISIAVRSIGGYLEVVVADTGSGIPEAQQDQVFQEFYQVGNPERDRTQGLGLGLSIVRRLVDLLGIDMQMQSSLSTGTTFTLRLVEIPAPTGLSAVQPAQLLDQRFDLRVLLIDDEKNVRTSLRILLEELGCTCIEATGTTQAVQQVQHQRPDLILADFRLRGSDSGLLAIAAVHKLWPGVAAVLVSGDTAPSRLQEAQYAGIKLLHKPVPPEALRKELAAVKRLQQVL